LGRINGKEGKEDMGASVFKRRSGGQAEKYAETNHKPKNRRKGSLSGTLQREEEKKKLTQNRK